MLNSQTKNEMSLYPLSFVMLAALDNNQNKREKGNQAIKRLFSYLKRTFFGFSPGVVGIPRRNVQRFYVNKG